MYRCSFPGCVLVSHFSHGIRSYKHSSHHKEYCYICDACFGPSRNRGKFTHPPSTMGGGSDRNLADAVTRHKIDHVDDIEGYFSDTPSSQEAAENHAFNTSTAVDAARSLNNTYEKCGEKCVSKFPNALSLLRDCDKEKLFRWKSLQDVGPSVRKGE